MHKIIVTAIWYN